MVKESYDSDFAKLVLLSLTSLAVLASAKAYEVFPTGREIPTMN